jgi:hypothetical protein
MFGLVRLVHFWNASLIAIALSTPAGVTPQKDLAKIRVIGLIPFPGTNTTLFDGLARSPI